MTEERATRPKPIREAHKEMTRARLVEAAVAVFEEHGYQSATIEQIAQRANVSRTTFYLHFQSKREVAIANGDRLLERYAALWPVLAKAPELSRAGIKPFMDAYLRMMKPDATARIIAFEANVSDPELTATGIGNMLDSAAALLEVLAAHGWTSKGPRATSHIATMLWGLNVLLWGQGVFGLKPPTKYFNDAIADMIVDGLSHAVSPPSGSSD